ncbi:hypothetical protein [Oleiagrimonas sp. C23AA]|uniref:hypothetical protein n=1 Tax=Oleiagrimonas sp. C23AA TaxID=2719047 RepID=UPI00142363E1|nr:hypothetical protein [Oleiagrimonas sp. C23AA]NII09342.1 hypothetical protein [Oleiagrimonas sp. C23AA]
MPRSAKLAAVVALMLVSPLTLAHDWSMVDNQVHFSTPDDWTLILQSHGEEEMMAFQIPDPSGASQKTLPRITVQAEAAPNRAAFQNFIASAHEHAQALPGFKRSASGKQRHLLVYQATENGVEQIYRERYYLRAGHAVQLTCIRPLKSPDKWASHFDAGCDQVAAALAR